MTPQQRAEAMAVAGIFHAALVALGFKALAEALELWQDVSQAPAQAPATLGKWLAQALRHMSVRRRDARRLALAYYRLERALHTGATIPSLESDKAIRVPLAELRDDFYDAVEELAPDVLDGEAPVIPDGASLGEADREEGEDPEALGEAVPERDDAPDREVEVETDDWDDLLDVLDDLDEAAEEEARQNLINLAVRNLEKKIKEAEEDAAREEAHRKVGQRQAAAVERYVLNAGRGSIYATGSRDARVIGWVRVSRTGTPCPFCAMLISRGITKKGAGGYRSEGSAAGPSSRAARAKAQQRDEPDKYHDNCHCYAMPIYSVEQYGSDPRFDLNRELSDLWASTGGKNWRHVIDRRNAEIKRAAEAA